MGTYHGEGRKFAKQLCNKVIRRNKLFLDSNITHKASKRLYWCFAPDYKIESHNTKPRYKTRSRQSIRYPADNFEIALRYRGLAYEAA